MYSCPRLVINTEKSPFTSTHMALHHTEHILVKSIDTLWLSGQLARQDTMDTQRGGIRLTIEEWQQKHVLEEAQYKTDGHILWLYSFRYFKHDFGNLSYSLKTEWKCRAIKQRTPGIFAYLIPSGMKYYSN